MKGGFSTGAACEIKCFEGRGGSEAEALVFVAAGGAGELVAEAAAGVDFAAADAVEGGFAAFAFEAGVVAAVVEEPEAEDEGGWEDAADGGGGEQGHGGGARLTSGSRGRRWWRV